MLRVLVHNQKIEQRPRVIRVSERLKTPVILSEENDPQQHHQDQDHQQQQRQQQQNVISVTKTGVVVPPFAAQPQHQPQTEMLNVPDSATPHRIESFVEIQEF